MITFGVAAFLLAMIHRSWRLAREEIVGTDEEDRRVRPATTDRTSWTPTTSPRRP